VQSLMIEVRRDLYMDETTGERHGGFARIQSVLNEFRVQLARFATT
jgi:N-formylglutamate amidohydrolase